jgi:hypothetical protein
MVATNFPCFVSVVARTEWPNQCFEGMSVVFVLRLSVGDGFFECIAVQLIGIWQLSSHQIGGSVGTVV